MTARRPAAVHTQTMGAGMLNLAFATSNIFISLVLGALMLAFVGFVDTFSVPREPLKKLFIAIFVIFTIYWGFQQFQTTYRHKTMRVKATPESLDILEKELNE